MSPWNKVMGNFAKGKLHSGSKKGPVVKSKKQAVAIMMSEQRKAAEGKAEYQPTGKPKKLTGQAKRGGR